MNLADMEWKWEENLTHRMENNVQGNWKIVTGIVQAATHIIVQPLIANR